MVIGGHDKAATGADQGTVDVNVFDPKTQTWSQVADMNVERWYATLMPLPNGSMLAIGGSYDNTHADGTPNRSVEIWERGGWTGFRPIASPSNKAQQIVAVRASGGASDLVMLGLDGRLWRSQEQPNGTFPDFANQPVGSAANRALRVSAVSLPQNGLDVYMVGLDHRLWHAVARPDGSWPDFAQAPVGSDSNRALDLAVVRKPSGQQIAFMVGMDNHLWRSDQAPDGHFPDFANQPVASKSNLAQRITAVLRSDNSIELFMIGMDGRVWHSRERSDGTFPDFAFGPVGSAANRATAIAVARGANGRLFVYMVGLRQGSQNRLWRTEEQADGTYPDFAQHPVGESELSVHEIALAPQVSGSGDVYIVNDPDPTISRTYQASGQFGWNELDIPQTSSITNGWFIYYPWAFNAPNGQVFVASASPRSYWIKLGPTPSLIEGPPRSQVREYGSAVMYAPGKILVLGGGTANATEPPLASAETIDLNSSAPVWKPTGSMHVRRQHATATILPDGQVLVTNGTQGGGEPSSLWESVATLSTEIWNPDTGLWTEVNPSPTPRTYHSNALLLPDGRVLVAGGGQGGGGGGVPDHPNADLYSPPYLFRGPRPAVTDAPAALKYSQSFSVTSPDSMTISKISLVRLGAATHAYNQNQLFVPLSFDRAAPGTLHVHAPANGTIAPPGDYLLFLVNTSGVPSIGKVVRIGS